MTRPSLLGELRGLLDIASDDELAAFRLLLSGVAFHHALATRRYTENQLSGDGRGGDHERGYRKGWNDAMRHMEREFFAPPSSSHNEFASAGGGATAQDGECKAWDCYCDAGAKGAYRLHPEAVCADCGDVDHKPDCPWRVIVPGKGE